MSSTQFPLSTVVMFCGGAVLFGLVVVLTLRR